MSPALNQTMRIIGDVCELGFASVDAVSRYGEAQGWAPVLSEDLLANIRPRGGIAPTEFVAWRPDVDKLIYVSASEADAPLNDSTDTLHIFSLELATELGSEADWAGMASRLFGTEAEGEQEMPDGSLKTLFWSAPPTPDQPSETAMRITCHPGNGFKILLINHRRVQTAREPHA